MPATVPEIIKMFYNCAGERQTFACRTLTPINAGLPHLARVCRYRARVHRLPALLLPPCCVAWRGTRKRRHQEGITALWDGRPTLWDGRPTLWDGRPTLWDDRPALRDAIGRHGALWDGIPTLWDGRPTLWDGRPTLWDGRPTLWDDRPALRDAIGRHGALCDGIPTLWDGIPTLWDGISVSLPHASEGLPPSNAN